jgi:hypothetical protein
MQRTQNIMWTNDGTGDKFGLARLLVVPHSVKEMWLHRNIKVLGHPGVEVPLRIGFLFSLYTYAMHNSQRFSTRAIFGSVRSGLLSVGTSRRLSIWFLVLPVRLKQNSTEASTFRKLLKWNKKLYVKPLVR